MKCMPVLVIIYNHKHESNIEILNRHYGGRFSEIYHLMPFYEGSSNNVIPVYENSRYFQGYIAQAFRNLPRKNVSHYLFVADDLILNPVINEHNYRHWLQIDDDTAFLPGFIQLHERKENEFWMRANDAYHYTIYKTGVEAATELPSIEFAHEKMMQFGFTNNPLSFDQIFPKPTFNGKRVGWRECLSVADYYFQRTKSYWCKRKFGLPYPLVGGYSDFFAVPSGIAAKFAHLCGVFSATELFVELAIPTSLILTAKNIKVEHSLSLQGKAMWTTDELKILDRYDYDFRRLIENYPAEHLYLHPIKLSKWRNL